nr:uncharacterized protein LOC109620531 isoform X1 [Crassostrea gigas]
MITIYYNSGKKSQLITNEAHKKVCKAIIWGKNVERSIVDIIRKHKPEEVSSGAASVVADECKELCFKNSNSVLQARAHHDILSFTWDKFHQELTLRAPNTLRIVSSMLSDVPLSPEGKPFLNLMHTISMAIHSRYNQMSLTQYLCGFVLMHGGCTMRDIDRLARTGLTMTSKSLTNKLASWEDCLYMSVEKIREGWERGEKKKYQLVGDNWDRNILPSYRTSQQKTISLHLFQVVCVVDRINPVCVERPNQNPYDLKCIDFIPSMQDQNLLCKELTFIVATALLNNIDQLKNIQNIYPKHLEHQYSAQAGLKTHQIPLGLFDCNEQKTQDVIKLLKEFSQKYVPVKDGEIVEEVFFGGDRLTDERIQCAQLSMANAATPLESLRGFISKIEDFHRLMNFLEAICTLTYKSTSAGDRGTFAYFRNILNARNVKGEVKNSYRAYKFLLYTIFDAMCCVLFFKEFGLRSTEEKIPVPELSSSEEKVSWINEVSERIVKNWFFENTDLVQELRNVFEDEHHVENYWINTAVENRFQCHHCDKSYAFIESLKTHESRMHGYVDSSPKGDKNDENKDELFDYVVHLFKLGALHKNLDTAVDMGDGHRSVRSAKYELPIYNKTNKTKYLIGSIHLTALVSGTLQADKQEQLIANRFVNLSGGANNNMALDEYVELLNRDTKQACSGHQTKTSILKHSKEYPHLIDAIKHIDMINEIKNRKGIHKYPSYKKDVLKTANELFEISAFSEIPGRTLTCRAIVCPKNPFMDAYKKLPTKIFRHLPTLPFCRLRNKHI